MKKICLIVVYLGSLPHWMNLFLKSCEMNPSVNWLIFTDGKIPKPCPKNVRFVKFDMNDFNRLATKKIGIDVKITRKYKLCDFKPAYGLIFEDYLKDYDFWGCTDLDIVYGQIRHFIDDKLMEKYEIITSKKYLVGHFTLYKNVQKVNQIFKKHKDYMKVFQGNRNYIFDEQGRPEEGIAGMDIFLREYLKVYSENLIIGKMKKNGLLKWRMELLLNYLMVKK